MDTPQFSNKPVVGISGGSPKSESVLAMKRQVEAAGGTVILLANHTDRSAADDLSKIDALVVMGNNADIDPARYGAKAHPKTFSERSTPQGTARADYEEQLMQAALDSGMPVMGVCAGMQRLNVLCGGTLHQHVPDLTGNDEHSQQNLGISFSTPVQPVLIEGGTKLGAIADEVTAVYAPTHSSNSPTVLMENSMHHQAVDRVGGNLRPAAFGEDEVTASDGSKQKLVEAIEADPNGKYGNQFVLGVQWHPEFGASPLGEKLAGHVVGEALQYAVEHHRQHPLAQIEQENALSAAQDYAAPSPPKDPEANRVRAGSMAAMVMRDRAVASQSPGQQSSVRLQ
jgi:putative glutamine amidotransferase